MLLRCGRSGRRRRRRRATLFPLSLSSSGMHGFAYLGINKNGRREALAYGNGGQRAHNVILSLGSQPQTHSQGRMRVYCFLWRPGLGGGGRRRRRLFMAFMGASLATRAAPISNIKAGCISCPPVLGARAAVTTRLVALTLFLSSSFSWPCGLNWNKNSTTTLVFPCHGLFAIVCFRATAELPTFLLFPT